MIVTVYRIVFAICLVSIFSLNNDDRRVGGGVMPEEDGELEPSLRFISPWPWNQVTLKRFEIVT